MPLPTVAYGVAMGGANLMVLVGLVTAGLSLRRRQEAHLPLVLGLGTFPALLIGASPQRSSASEHWKCLWPVSARHGLRWGVQLCRGRYKAR
jgi:hypothetical protein